MKVGNQITGGLLIVASTTIGAGLLAVPLVSSKVGFFPSFLMLGGMWGLMLYASFISVELNIHFGHGVSVAHMAEKTLGKVSSFLGSLSIVWLFYALLTAYVAGGTSLFGSFAQTEIPKTTPDLFPWVVMPFFILLCVFVIKGAAWLDYTNRLLFFVKTLLFLTIVFCLMPAVTVNYLQFMDLSFSSYLSLIPIFFTAFGFHGSIPPLVDFLKKDRTSIKKAFVLGSLLPFLFYILWIMVCLGSVPFFGDSSFFDLHASGGELGNFMKLLEEKSKFWAFAGVANIFSFLAIATSFLGVSMGLYSYVQEVLRTRLNKHDVKFMSAFITFVPPLTLAVLAPENLFVGALGFAAIALSVLALILPCCITLCLMRKKAYASKTIGKPGVIFTLLCGVAMIAIEIYNLLG